MEKLTELGNSFKSYSSNRFLSGNNEFLESNSIVAKFAFLILVLIIFVVFLRIGTLLLGIAYTPSSSPILINGMIDAKQLLKITQDPSIKGSKPILRSQNENNGLVFTWSVWINIEDLQYKKGEYKHIFHKGNVNFNMTEVPYGMNYPNNAPGLYIAPSTNDLIVVMNTFENIIDEVVIKDIPLNKWLNIIIRVDEQHRLDVYINGRLTKRHIMDSVPRQNYDDVYVSMNGGFSGFTSNLRYFNKAIGPSDIQAIVSKGPSLNMVSNSNSTLKSGSQFLSTRWYLSDNHLSDD